MMKALLKIIIGFGLILNINAQSMEKPSFKIGLMDKTRNTLNLDQKISVMKDLHIDVSPQLGNLFLTRIEAKKAGINLKDFYNDFDFGFKMGLNYLLKNNLNLKALYSFGMLKFNYTDMVKAESYIVKLSIDYVF